MSTGGTDDRAAVLARVRRALGRSAEDAPSQAAAAARIEHPRANTIPLRAQLQEPQLGELFEEMVCASQATFERIADLEAVPGAVARWSADQGIEGAFVVAPSSPLAELAWVEDRVMRRLAESGDAIAVSEAALGVAETGTLLVGSGPATPVSANFLPDNQVLVLRATDIVGTPEDAWQRLRAQGALPRTLNWITGPSRSGDIEMTMLMGAHGPIRLHVLVLDQRGGR